MEVRDWSAVKEHYLAGHTICETCRKFNLPARAWRIAVEAGLLPPADPPRLTPSEKRSRIQELLSEGHSQAVVGLELGLSKATVSYHARRLGVPVHDEFGRRYDWGAVQQAHDAGMRALECCKHFGFSKATWSKVVATGRVKPRSHLIPLDQLLVKGRRTNRSHLKQRLLDAGLKENRCEICGITEWLGNPLNVQLHHKNGDGTDNRLTNLEFLCPNCHSQTDTYGGRNGHRRKGHLRLVEPPEDGQEDVA